MREQVKDCEACFGTGNEPRMTSLHPTWKILFRPCPRCGGTGKERDFSTSTIGSSSSSARAPTYR
jgi:DnaJ-class molecular chaperone